MTPKLWCVSTSHPLVHQIAKKYNITTHDAKDILNDAREKDSSLQNDNLNLEDIKDNDAFKQAISAYEDKFIDADAALLNRVLGDQETTTSIEEQIRDDFGLNLDQEEIARIARSYTERFTHRNKSKTNTRRILTVLHGFKDGRRLDFIGDWVCRQMSAIMNNVEYDPKFREEYRIQLKTKRQDYYADETVKNVLRSYVLDYLREARDVQKQEGNEELASELQCAIDNFDTLLFMYGGSLFRNEGVSFNMNGDFTARSQDEPEEKDDEDSDDDPENNNIEEHPIGSFSVSEQNKSVSTKLQGPVKTMLAGMRRMDRNGDDVLDQFGYGLSTFISVPTATNQILSICNGCETFSEMMNALQKNIDAYPWIEQLVNALDTADAYDASGEFEITANKKEQLQSQFFQSFRKQFTRFRHAYKAYDEDGYMYFVEVDSNTDHRADRMLRSLRKNFVGFSGIDILSGGIIDFDKIFELSRKLEAPTGKISANDQSIESQIQRVRNIASEIEEDNELSGKNRSYKDAILALNKPAGELQKILKSLGVDASDNMLNAYLDSEINGAPRDTEVDNRREFSKEKYERRYRNLENLYKDTKNLLDELKEWKGAMDRGETTDTPRTNPFNMRKNTRSDYNRIRYIRRKYMNVIETICSASPDSFESFAHMKGKDYYSWNNPSSIQTIVEKLKNSSKAKDYIDEKYGKDSMWFVKHDAEDPNGTHFYSDWLDEIYNSNGGLILEYSEKPMFDETEYNKMSDTNYGLSMLNDYFATTGLESDYAWYRMLIASDKKRYSSIRYKKYNSRNTIETEKDFRNIISRKAVDFFAQELIRANEVIHHAMKRDMMIDGYDPKQNDTTKAILQKIKNKQKVTRDDILDSEGKYVFRNTGVSFYLNKFINDEIQDRNSELGTYVIDKIFNSDISGKPERVIEDIQKLGLFKDAFKKYMQDIRDKVFDRFDKCGMLDEGIKKTINENDGSTVLTTNAKFIIGSLKQWHIGDDSFTKKMMGNDAGMRAMAERQKIDLEANPQHETYCYHLAQFYEDLEEFVYNNWLAKANMSEIFDVDLAFYGGTPNFQKRNAQVISAGNVTDPEAKIHGKKVSDGFYRSITLKTDLNNKSSHIENIRVALAKAANTIADPAQREQFRLSAEDTLSKLDGFDATDGQALVGLTSLRKRMAGQGEWSRSSTEEMDNDPETMTDEAVYRRWKNGTTTIKDLMHVFAQVQKPFVYSQVPFNRAGTRGNITVPIQHKNSEYALCFLSAFTDSKLNSQMEAISRFLEETAKDDDTYGIDTVNFDSGVKIGGNSKVIDITGLSPQETLEKLKEAVYGKNPVTETVNDKTRKRYVDGAVTTYDARDYKIQQIKPEHFKYNAQPMGSQLKILAINNINDNSTLTLPGGIPISGKELKRRYFSLLRKKIQRTEGDFRGSLGLDLAKKDRLHKLSGTLKNAMATDSKFSVEMRHGLSIIERDGVEQFALPLDEPGQQSAVEAMLYSKIRKTFYKEKTNGGIVVQATSWGASDDLAIRFYSSNPEDKDGLVPTKKQFAKKSGLTGAKLNKAYEDYLKQYQTGYAYFEAEVPMPGYVHDMLLGPDGQVEEKYINPDGTWNMEEIRKTVPASAFDAICYRVPTEAKYSVMLCKIVRFSPEASGSAAKYPQELTVFTGSDFDVDTDTVELRPIPGSQNEDVDSELFDLQVAALRSSQGLLETFKSGDFSDLSALSYYTTLLGSERYTRAQLDQMTPKQLKTKCAEVEDLDLMNPVTDLTLRTQNSDANDMIAIAAVGVTSHAFVSLYNDIDTNDAQRDPEKNPENFVRIRFNTGTSKRNSESFRVINDKDKNNVTERNIGNDPIMKDHALLDAVYDMDGKLIGTEISKYVGGSADAAKDAAMARLNITTKTLPVLIMMHRLGISSDVARLFIAQPVIRDVMDKLNNASAFGYMNIDRACDAVRDELFKEYPGDETAWTKYLELINHSNDSELVYSELLDNIENKGKQSIDNKLRQLHIFQVLASKQQLVRNLDSFTRYNSSAAMRGSSFLDRYAKRKQVERLMNNLLKEKPVILLPQNVDILPGFMPNEYGRLCSMFPYIAQTINGEDELTEKIIRENMKTYNPAFFAIAKRLNIEDDADAMKTLYAGWKNYLMFAGPNRIADFWNRDTARYYTKDFAEEYLKFMNELEENEPEFYNNVVKNNSFISSIGVSESKDGFDQFYVLNTNVNGIQGQALEQYKKDWADLLNHEYTRGLAIDLGIYFLSRSAAYNRDTPVHLIPLAVKEAIPNYMNVFERADKISMDTFDVENFLKAFARNNFNNTKVVPTFGRENNDTVQYDQKQGKLIFPKAYINRLASKYLIVENTDTEDESEVKAVKFRSPVVQVKSTTFPTGQLFIVDGEIEVAKLGDDEVYIIDATPTTPLGIPNQFVEYVGISDEASLFNEGDVPLDQFASVQDQFFDNEEEIVIGKRTGTFLEDNPYGYVAGDAEKFLARDEDDREQVEGKEVAQSPYLESREFLKRASKLAGAFGFKFDSSNRGYMPGMRPTYTMNISPTEFNVNQHERAKKVAALMTAFTGTGKSTSVKTYISKPTDEFNTVEYTIKLNLGDDINTKRKRDSVARGASQKLGLPFFINSDTNELQILAPFEEFEDAQEAIRASKEMTARVREFFDILQKYGLTASSEIEVNYAQVEDVDKNTIEETLTSIRNEAIENERESSGANPENARSNGRGKDWKPVRISYIADLALRKARGEKVDDEVRLLFNERPSPLRNTNASYRSSLIVDKISRAMPDNVADEVRDLLYNDNLISPEAKIERLILNTANWIIGHRSEDALVGMMDKIGIKQESGKTIIDTIKTILKDLDIC